MLFFFGMGGMCAQLLQEPWSNSRDLLLSCSVTAGQKHAADTRSSAPARRRAREPRDAGQSTGCPPRSACSESWLYWLLAAVPLGHQCRTRRVALVPHATCLMTPAAAGPPRFRLVAGQPARHPSPLAVRRGACRLP